LWLRGFEAESSSQRNEFHLQWSVSKVRPRGTFKTVEAVVKGNPEETGGIPGHRGSTVGWLDYLTQSGRRDSWKEPA